MNSWSFSSRLILGLKVQGLFDGQEKSFAETTKGNIMEFLGPYLSSYLGKVNWNSKAWYLYLGAGANIDSWKILHIGSLLNAWHHMPRSHWKSQDKLDAPSFRKLPQAFQRIFHLMNFCYFPMRNLASFLAKRMNLKGVASDSNGVSENIFHLKNLRSKALSLLLLPLANNCPWLCIWTNTFKHLCQIHFAICANTFCHWDNFN